MGTSIVRKLTPIRFTFEFANQYSIKRQGGSKGNFLRGIMASLTHLNEFPV